MGVWVFFVCDWGMKNLGIEDWLYLRLYGLPKIRSTVVWVRGCMD